MRGLLSFEDTRGLREWELSIVEIEVLFICCWWDQETVHSFSLPCIPISQKGLIPSPVFAYCYFHQLDSEFEPSIDLSIFDRGKEFMNHKKVGIMDMILIWTWLWFSISEDIRSVKYPFITITPKSTLTWSGCICYGPIYESNRSVCKLFVFNKNTGYDITVCKNLKYKKNVQWCNFSTSWHKITPNELTCVK